MYHDCPMLNETNTDLQLFRLQISQQVAHIIKSAMGLLGISVPQRM